MRTAPTNPYQDATLDTLRDACARCARAIEDRHPRTPAERQALADDVRFLLIAAAHRFTTGRYTPANPEDALEKSNLANFTEQFLAWHRREANRLQREQRSLTLQRAADYVLGKRARDWLFASGGWKNGDRGVIGI